jgi:hypothetical protein
MLFLADTHVHLYESYDLDRAFSSAFANLGRAKMALGFGPAQPAALALFLTERHDCRAFERLRSGEERLAAHRVEPCPEGDLALVVRSRSGEWLYLVAGRQIVTRERLELLALAAQPTVPDGGDILDTVGRIREGGGVPVLAWAPGKWLGRRGRVVASVLSTVAPSHLLVGDTSMRPRGYPTPRLMGEAAQRGFVIVGGTDPLPFRGQEAVIGRYGVSADADIDARSPVPSLRALLTAGGGRLSLAGRRDTFASVVMRLVRHRLAP